MLPSLTSVLASISAEDDARNRTERLTRLLDSLFTNEGDVMDIAEAIQYFINVILGDTVSLVVSRPVISNLVRHLVNNASPLALQVLPYIVDRLSSKTVSFFEEWILLSASLADIYEACGQHLLAAHVLSHVATCELRHWTVVAKGELHVRILRLYIQSRRYDLIATFVKRAAEYRNDVSPPSLLWFDFAVALTYHSQKKFLDASRSLFRLSQSLIALPDTLHIAGAIVTPETLLEASAFSVIMSSAGPKRCQLLTLLYKDDRTRHLSIFPVFEKVYLERLLDREDVALLKTYDRHLLLDRGGEVPDTSMAVSDMSDIDVSGMTTMDHNLIEHNLTAAAGLYANISFNELGELLGVTAQQAERIASRMISEDRMDGRIDQIDTILYFEHSEAIVRWDDQISWLCEDVNSVVSEIVSKYGTVVLAGSTDDAMGVQ